jgi:hypothetical protein
MDYKRNDILGVSEMGRCGWRDEQWWIQGVRMLLVRERREYEPP